jgi:hypothetical protein
MKQELMKKIGKMQQIAYARKIRFEEGRFDGM